jgi:hypothetical protein
MSRAMRLSNYCLKKRLSNCFSKVECSCRNIRNIDDGISMLMCFVRKQEPNCDVSPTIQPSENENSFSFKK